MTLYKNRMIYRFICMALVVCLFIVSDPVNVYAKGGSSKIENETGTESGNKTESSIESETDTADEDQEANGNVIEFVYGNLLYYIDMETSTAVLGGSISEKLTALNIPSVIVYNETEIPVTAIGDYAFLESSLTSVSLGKNITMIGEGAFAYSDELVKVTINKKCSEIGDAAFLMCGALKSVKISKKAKTKSIGEGAFAGTAIKSFAIPNATVKIGDAAFGECEKLTTFTIGNKLKEIGEGAFAGCNALNTVKKSKKNKYFDVEENLIYSKGFSELISAAAASGDVKLNEETEYISSRAFEGNSRIVTVEIPENVLSVGECAFMNCSSLETVILDGGMIEMDENVFYGCPKFSEIRLGNVSDDVVPVG